MDFSWRMPKSGKKTRCKHIHALAHIHIRLCCIRFYRSLFTTDIVLIYYGSYDKAYFLYIRPHIFFCRIKLRAKRGEQKSLARKEPAKFNSKYWQPFLLFFSLSFSIYPSLYLQQFFSSAVWVALLLFGVMFKWFSSLDCTRHTHNWQWAGRKAKRTVSFTKY